MSSEAVLKMNLVGSNPSPKITGLEKLPGKSHYLSGNNAEKWHTDVSRYAKVKYEDIYPGIDVVYYGNQQQLEYDFVVAPGANPNAIRMEFKGSDSLSLDEKGNLILHTKVGEVLQHTPRIYQDVNGERKPVAGSYVFLNPEQEAKKLNSESKTSIIGFQVAAYDTKQPLIIDPVLTYSTYLGGANSAYGNIYGWDLGISIAVDASGNAYLTGDTWSIDFPTANPYQSANAGLWDIFVAKLSADGSTLLYSTYLGGTGNDEGSGIAVDSSGNIYIVGVTDSIDFPVTQSAFQAISNGFTDIIVAKLNASGNILLYSTYLGGSGEDIGMDIALDASGNTYITGVTASADLPTASPIQSVYGGGAYDAFFAKLDPTVSGAASLIYSTYLGGSDDDRGIRVTVDNTGNLYSTGYTTSTNFPTLNPIQSANAGGPFDAFVAKINATGSALSFSTFLGGAGGDGGIGIAVDKNSGEVYVTGRTDSVNFPTTNGTFDATCGTDGTCNGGFIDGFVAKINAGGSSLVYSTYLGGSGEDRGIGIAVDSSGNAYVAGRTSSTDFSTLDPIQETYGGGDFDAFVTKINSAGSNLVYSTYLGGSAVDPGWYGIPSEDAQGIALDASDNAYVIGYTWSTDFPTANAYQNAKAGDWDVFVAKISPAAGGNISPTVTLSANITSGNAPLSVGFTASASDSDGTIAKYEWDFDGNGVYDSDTGAASTASYTYSSAGIYNSRVRVTDNGGATATSFLTITVNSTSGGNSGGGSDSGGNSGGGGCGFVKSNNSNGQGTNGKGIEFAVMLIITLGGIALAKRAARQIKA